MINIFKHLLPRARAWSITIDKQLRQFFNALSVSLIETIRAYYDGIWSGIDPQTTTDLKRWENQFGLIDTGLTTQQRRDRLDAAWATTGGQDPKYLQDTLQANGFDVYVHEWWAPGTEAAVGVSAQPTIRNPLTYLKQTYPGDTSPSGYPLVNIIYDTTKNYTMIMGEPLAVMGEILAEMGEYSGFIESQKPYTIPNDTGYFPYFIYIGGETFGTLAGIPAERQREFETLCLKLCPAQLWLGLLINYT